MTLTRRGFVLRFGHATAGTVTATMLAARGFEDRMAAYAAGQERPEIPPGMIRLGSNENPYGPGPHVVAAVERALHDDGNRYTRMPMILTGRLASMLGVSSGALLVSAGSGDLLRAAVLAYVGPDRPLVAASPTFEAPVRTAESLRLPIRLVPLLPSLANDLARMTEQGRGAGLVYICNPDNPTGTFQARPAVVTLLDTLASTSPDTVVMVDEAYFDCADDPTYGSVVAIAAERRNVVVVRTFSKIHGLAGMRIGYVVAHPETLERMRPYVGGGVVACASAAAAMASLDDSGYFRRQQELNRDARARLTRALTDLGYPPVPSQANFVMVDVRRDVRDFGGSCRALGVLVGRPFPPLATQARISFGTPDEMTRAIDVFGKVLRT
jgi:histidinol-phosphate aminotransferase